MSVLVVVRSEPLRDRLVELGLAVAGAKEEELYVLHLSDGPSMPKVEWAEVDGLHEAWVKAANAARMVEKVAEEIKSSLVMVNDDVNHTPQQQRMIGELMERLDCEVFVIRLGEGSMLNEKVLVPCAGGRHSKVALRLAAKIAGKNCTALFVEPHVDEVSESVGFSHLHRYVRRAGVNVEDIRCHVELEDDPFKGIRNELEKTNYGLMVIGATGHSTVRRKLFGTVPERLMRGVSGLSVGVLRAARPMRHRFLHQFERLLHLNVPQLNRDERVALFDQVERASRWSFDFAVLMVLATSIAALGLLADSGAVVIGAMLVAPLMMPLLGGGLSLVQGNWPLWKRSQKAVFLGFLSALGIGVMIGFIARFLGMPLTSELAARGEPSTLDLGVAFISGIAASYCLARPKLSGALAGVAIAAALVPPIATTGICLAVGEFDVAQGAALLFGTNVVAIVLGAAVNFFIAGVRGRKSASGVWAQRFFIMFALIMAGLVVPLSSALIGRIAGPEQVEKVLQLEGEKYGMDIKRVQRAGYMNGVQVLEITVESPVPISTVTLKKLKQRLQEDLKEDVILKVRTILVNTLGSDK